MADNTQTRPMGGPGRGPRRGPRRGPMGEKIENPGKIFIRLMKYVMKNYGVHFVIVFLCIIISVLASVQGTLFQRTLIDEYILPMIGKENPDFSRLLQEILRVAGIYLVGIAATYTYNRLMVNVTQGTMQRLRNDMFSHMEKLPIRYFDTHTHGDIMSMYTNDIDTLRQMISQSIPQIFSSAITVVSVLISMVVLNIPLTIVTLLMVGIMMYSTKYVAGKSGKYFGQQQTDIGKVNGYIE
nr:ABC transporter ATP-binding protein [Acetatifactor sp.]